jgi:hypothetical protein
LRAACAARKPAMPATLAALMTLRLSFSAATPPNVMTPRRTRQRGATKAAVLSAVWIVWGCAAVSSFVRCSADHRQASRLDCFLALNRCFACSGAELPLKTARLSTFWVYVLYVFIQSLNFCFFVYILGHQLRERKPSDAFRMRFADRDRPRVRICVRYRLGCPRKSRNAAHSNTRRNAGLKQSTWENAA